MRHGDAVVAAENPLRPLSAAGRARVERVAQAAAQRGAQPAAIYHSGILRAAQTSEIVARYLPSAKKVAMLSGLLPDDDPAVIKSELEMAEEPIMLVGHLPFMGRLAGFLIYGDPERQAAEFIPGDMLCCTRSPAGWKISWQIAAELA